MLLAYLAVVLLTLAVMLRSVDPTSDILLCLSVACMIGYRIERAIRDLRG
jgi:hypothetical protein